MRRLEKEITSQSRLEEILDDAPVCRIALTDHPAPYLIPVNFVRVDDCLYFHSAPEGHKMDLIRADPRVRFEVDQLIDLKPDDTACRWGAGYESAIGIGTAAILESDQEKEMALHYLMRKYSGRHGWAFDPDAVARVAVVRINIEAVTGKASPQR